MISKELEQEDIKKLLDVPDPKGKYKYRDEIDLLLKPDQHSFKHSFKRK